MQDIQHKQDRSLQAQLERNTGKRAQEENRRSSAKTRLETVKEQKAKGDKGGIIDQLKNAESPEEVKRLFAKSKKYEYISPKTKRKVNSLVKGKLAELKKL